MCTSKNMAYMAIQITFTMEPVSDANPLILESLQQTPNFSSVLTCNFSVGAS